MNAIIFKPALKTWKCIVNFDSDYLISNQLNTKFQMTYKIANYGMPPGIKLDTKEFKRPARPTPEVQDLLVSLDRNISGINDISRNDSNTGYTASITVIDTTSANRYLI